jgi:hypothetical protein
MVHEIKTSQKTESAASHDAQYTGPANLMWTLKAWYKHGLLLISEVST